MGAMGVVVPMVKTVEEAECIVRATRLPPEGIRSWGPLRGSHYGFDTEDYLRRINNNILVVLIVETREAVDNLDAIAAVPGVDVLTLGPWDLSLSLGLNPLDLPLPEVDAVLSRMVEVARTGQVSAGGGVDTPEELREFYARGVMFLEFGTDYSLLANAVQQSLRVFRE